MTKLDQLLVCSLTVFVLTFTTGCSTVNKIKKYQHDQKEAIEVQKAHYLDLKRDIATNGLPNGTPSSVIKERYGAPDDIFYSNSSGSSFQIWTYNISKNRLNDTRFDPILLYINNEVLISWKY